MAVERDAVPGCYSFLDILPGNRGLAFDSGRCCRRPRRRLACGLLSFWNRSLAGWLRRNCAVAAACHREECDCNEKQQRCEAVWLARKRVWSIGEFATRGGRLHAVSRFTSFAIFSVL